MPQGTKDTEKFQQEHKIFIRELWLKQLTVEYERICYQYDLSLDNPIFSLSQSSTQLGAWDPISRIIKISEILIEGHCWSKVIEVLKHEMAHQIVSELFYANDAHGEYFQQACRMLGVEKWARGPSMLDFEDLERKTQSGLTEQEEKMLRKAQKLLALAQSSNEHEALEAMKKVQYLYQTYHLESLRQLEKPSFTSIHIHHKKRRIEAYQTMIGNLLIKHFHVQIIHSSLYDAATQKEYKCLEILGIHRHVQLAEYVYWFIFNNLPILWQDPFHCSEQIKE